MLRELSRVLDGGPETGGEREIDLDSFQIDQDLIDAFNTEMDDKLTSPASAELRSKLRKEKQELEQELFGEAQRKGSK